MKESFDELIEKTLEWANQRGLLKVDNSKSQMLKLMEEAGETAAALLKNKREELQDGIGDCFVVLIILAAQQGMNPVKCLEAAYNEIANRKGQMISGSFVKTEDL